MGGRWGPASPIAHPRRCSPWASLLGAIAVGVVGALSISLWLFAFVAAGTVLTVAYNLELFGGRMHSDLWFAFAWGRLPRADRLFVQARELRLDGTLSAGACLL